MLKVIESAVADVTFQTRYDQLFVPLCRVLSPSFFSVSYFVPSIEYVALPMRPT